MSRSRNRFLRKLYNSRSAKRRSSPKRKSQWSKSLRFESLEAKQMLAAQAIPFSELSVTSSITLTSGQATGQNVNIENTFNGLGLTGDEHNTNFTQGWLTSSSSTSAAGKWIKVDLGGEYVLDSLDVWNGSPAGLNSRGIQQADIFYATNDPNLNTNHDDLAFKTTGWQPFQLNQDQQFAQVGPGTDDYGVTDHISLGNVVAGDVTASFLAIRVDSNYGDTGGVVALAEMKIIGEKIATPRTLTFDSNVTVTGAFTGEGTQGSGTTFQIAAPAAPAGFEFHSWSGAHVDAFTTGGFNSQSTTFTMPDADTTLTAVYLATGSVVAQIPKDVISATSSADYFDPATPSLPGGAEALGAFNGDGLDQIGDGVLHNTNFTHGWLSIVGGNATDKWLKVDLGAEYFLTSLDVWNGNNLNNSDSGIQQADIFYSLSDPGNNLSDADTVFNTTGWTEMISDQQFAQSTGAADAPRSDEIILDGSKARYLAFRIDSNHGADNGVAGLAEMKIHGVKFATPRTLTLETDAAVTGTFTGGGVHGAETAFTIAAPAAPAGFEFHSWSGAHVDAFTTGGFNSQSTTFTMPDADTTLTAVYLATGSVVAQIPKDVISATSSADYFDPATPSLPGGAEALGAFNGDGLDQIGDGVLHNTNFTHGWLSIVGGNATDKWLKVDLGAEYFLTSLDVWNGNNLNNSDSGIQQADIFYSLSDPGNNLSDADTVFNTTGWTEMISDQQFAQSTGAADAPRSDEIILDGSKARYLAFRIDSNHGADNGVAGLAEMKIHGVKFATPRTLTLETDAAVTGTFTGGGVHGAETAFTIAAPAAPAGFEFHSWSGAHVDAFTTGGFNSQSTTFTMPDADTTLTAVYLATGSVVAQIPKDVISATSSADYFDPATPSLPGGAEALGAFNGDGLDQIGDGVLHNTNFTHGWLSIVGGNATDKWLKVDLGAEYFLTSLDVWNGNNLNNSDSGIQQADIFYSLSDPGNNLSDADTVFNTTGWTEMISDQQFAQSTGAADAPRSDEIILDGSKARYLAFRIDSNHGADNGVAGLAEMKIHGVKFATPRTLTLETDAAVTGTFTGGGVHGAETAFTIAAPAAPSGFEFFGWSGADVGAFTNGGFNSQSTTFTMPDADTTLTAVYLEDNDSDNTNKSVVAAQIQLDATGIRGSSVFGNATALKAFNGAGLTAGEHSSVVDEGWLGVGNEGSKWITIDLGGEYALTSLDVWNGNQLGNSSTGIQQADIYFASSDPGNNNVNLTDVEFNAAGWQELIPNQQFAKSTGADNAPQTDQILLDGTKARYLAISVDSNFGAVGGTVGLAEMQINGVFIPAPTFPLTVIGGIGTNGESFGEYSLEESVQLAADDPAAGFIFDAWIGDVAGVADVTSSTTYLAMTTAGASVEATYKSTTPINFIPDLALDKTISSVTSFFGTDTAENAIDGDASTYWRPATNDTEPALVVDLGKVYDNIDRVNLGFELARIPQRYTLEVSTDNASWTTVTDNANVVQTNRQDNQFEPVKARYVRYTAQEFNPVSGFTTLDTLEVYQTRPVQEFVRRQGIPNFIQKLEAGQDVTVAYLGGSVTQAIVQDDPVLGGFRVQSLRELGKLYPASTFTEINSSFGGQGTAVGKQWIDENDFTIDPVTQAAIFGQRDRLTILNRPIEAGFRPNGTPTDQAKNPDLVFIEFAINDSHASSETMIADLESIVRKIWSSNNPNDGTSNNTTDIVFLYTQKTINGLTETTLPNGSTVVTTYPSTGGDVEGENFANPTDNNDALTVNEGRYQVSASRFEEVADYYGIPSIHLTKDYFRRLVNDGEFIHQGTFEDRPGTENDISTANPADLPVFSPDGIHPNATVGHTLYEEALERGFNGLQGNAGTLVHDLNALVPIRDAVSFDLDVVDGTGTGSYLPGTQFLVNADLPGETFLAWTGDVSFVVDVNAASTLFTMPSAGATLTATYSSTVATSNLTVIGGTGTDVMVDVGTEVIIAAFDPIEGSLFTGWTGDVAGVANVNAPITTFTIQSTDSTITASYALAFDLTVFGGTVVGGSNSGPQLPGTGIDIVAPEFVDGLAFIGWAGADVSQFLDATAFSTTFTMPAENTLLTATYEQPGSNSEVIPFSELTIASSGSYPGGNIEDVFNGQGFDQVLNDGKHSNLWQDGWLSNLDPAGEWIKIDLGGSYTLDSLEIWNGNQLGLASRGLQQADIFVAQSDPGNNINNSGATFDPTGWTPLLTDQQFTIAPGNGSGRIDSTDTIGLSGTASFLAIRVDSNYGHDRVAISEIQISGTPTTAATSSLAVIGGSGTGVFDVGSTQQIDANPALTGFEFSAWTGDTTGIANTSLASTSIEIQSSNATITATYIPVGSGSEVIPFSELTLTASSTDTYAGSISSIEQAFNNAGILANDEHDGVFSNGWISDNGAPFAAGEWIKVDLNGVYDLTSLEIWNGNQANVTRRGIQQGDIYVATSDPGGNPGDVFNASAWTPLILDQQFAQSPGGNIASTDTISLVDSAGNNLGVSYLAIHVDSTYASDLNSVSIGEIRISGIDQSTSTATSSLAVLGGTGTGVFDVGSTQQIDANPALTGFEFSAWTGDTTGIANTSLASTSIEIQSSNATITATYIPVGSNSEVIPFSELTIASSGSYPGGNIEDVFNGQGFDQVLNDGKHSNLWQDGWLSNLDPAGEWIKIDLGGSYTLDSLEIWNGNQLGLASRGLQQADIFVAQSDPGNNINNSGAVFDPTGWTPLLTDQQFTIAPGNGSGRIDSTDTIGLSGTASFLAIRVDSNYGHDRVAISEIQISGTPNVATENFVLTVNGGTGGGSYPAGSVVSITAPDVENAAFLGWIGDVSFVTQVDAQQTTFVMPSANATITADYELAVEAFPLIPPSQLAAISSSQYSIYDVEDAFDSTGLTGDQHNADADEGWLSTSTGAAGQWVIVDLGDTYTLDHLRVWNYNDAVWHERGIAQADIYYSTSGVGNNSHNSGAAFDASGWQTLVNDQAFTRASGADFIDNTDASIDLLQEMASHIAIVVDSNFSGNFVGFAEMQFYGSPASAPLAASFAGGDEGSLTGLTLESQQLSATDEALLLFEEIEEEEESDGSLLSDPYSSNDLDNAFQQLGLLGEEGEEEEEEDFGGLLVSSGLNV